jgi:hypothetical protein
VAALAESGGIPVHRPPDPNAPEVIRLIRSLEPDNYLFFLLIVMFCPTNCWPCPGPARTTCMAPVAPLPGPGPGQLGAVNGETEPA